MNINDLLQENLDMDIPLTHSLSTQASYSGSHTLKLEEYIREKCDKLLSAILKKQILSDLFKWEHFMPKSLHNKDYNFVSSLKEKTYSLESQIYFFSEMK